ncbi:MAG: hypothetical protein AAGC67_21170 [Myxococcota bacterium]
MVRSIEVNRARPSRLFAGALALLALAAPPAWAVSAFTERFDAGNAGWLDGDRDPVRHHASGGRAGAGYVSFEAPAFDSGSGTFGDPLKLMFRGNASAAASGGAFVGDWIEGGVRALRVTVRHNHASALRLYVRIAGSFGAGASLSNHPRFAIEPDVWTTVTIPIEDGDPPFVSYGTSRFPAVFERIKTVQIGLYLPGKTGFDGLRMDLDEVAIETAAPEAGASDADAAP